MGDEKLRRNYHEDEEERLVAAVEANCSGIGNCPVCMRGSVIELELQQGGWY